MYPTPDISQQYHQSSHLLSLHTGFTVQEAVEKGLSYTLERTRGCGGAIAVTPSGDVGVSFNTQGMSWASVKEGKVHCGIYTGEDKQEPL